MLLGLNSAHFRANELSDHCPIVIDYFKVPRFSGGRPFKFLNMFVEHPNFLSKIHSTQQSEKYCNPMFLAWRKLIVVKSTMKALHRDHFTHTDHRIVAARDHLKEVQQAMKFDHLNARLHEQEKQAILDLRHEL